MVQRTQTSARLRTGELERSLGNRALVYVGPRGLDALPLMGLHNLEAVFGLIAPSGLDLHERCLEEISGIRVELNSYSLDEDDSPPSELLRRELYARFARPCAVVAYAPSQTLTRGWLMGGGAAIPLALFFEKQTCFDFKPWVERELQTLGVQTIPWTYSHSLESSSAMEPLLEGRSVVVRLPRSRGGLSVWLVSSPDELASLAVALAPARLVCVGPYLESDFSVNVNACVFRCGATTIHGASVQLVGVEPCTTRALGYAGNDFGAITALSGTALGELDSLTRLVGRWLASQGFIGAFGLDALVRGDDVTFVELNPRFQASSAMAAMIDDALERPNQYLNHVAAFIGLDPADSLSLGDLVRKQGSHAQAMVYNRDSDPVSMVSPPAAPFLQARLLPRPEIVVNPQAILAALWFEHMITTTGYDLSAVAAEAVHQVRACFVPQGAAC